MTCRFGREFGEIVLQPTVIIVHDIIITRELQIAVSYNQEKK